MRVRGRHPFQTAAPVISHDFPWQDWISSGGVFDDISGSFIRAAPPNNVNDDNGDSAQTQLPTTSAGAGSSVGLTFLMSTL